MSVEGSLDVSGTPASTSAAHPPVSAKAFGYPLLRSCRVTRTLVASSVQAQYTTSVALESRCCARTARSASSGGTRTEPMTVRASAS